MDDTSSLPEETQPPADAQTVTLYVIDMTTDSGEQMPVVPCLIFPTPQGPQGNPLVAFTEEQATHLAQQAQHVANNVGKPLRKLVGTLADGEPVQPQLVALANAPPPPKLITR